MMMQGEEECHPFVTTPAPSSEAYARAHPLSEVRQQVSDTLSGLPVVVGQTSLLQQVIAAQPVPKSVIQ